MAASVLSVRVDSSIKDSFAELCEELGMTSSVAVNMFMKQMLRERSLPFVPSLGKTKRAKTSLQTFWILPRLSPPSARQLARFPPSKP